MSVTTVSAIRMRFGLDDAFGTVNDERGWKFAKRISSIDRPNLKAASIQRLVFGKLNLNAMGYGSFDLPRSEASRQIPRQAPVNEQPQQPITLEDYPDMFGLESSDDEDRD